MNIICVTDDHNGLMFNHRRLSRDRILSEKILEISRSGILRMSPDSAELFENLPDHVQISDDFLSESETGDFCFVEDRSLVSFGPEIETFYLFHWNRLYPSDFKLDFLPSENGFHLSDTADFLGSSHDDITLEIWQRP